MGIIHHVIAWDGTSSNDAEHYVNGNFEASVDNASPVSTITLATTADTHGWQNGSNSGYAPNVDLYCHWKYNAKLNRMQIMDKYLSYLDNLQAV